MAELKPQCPIKRESDNILSFLTLSDCRVSADAILCYCCGLRAFKELAYKYRQNIPSSELPGQVKTIVFQCFRQLGFKMTCCCWVKTPCNIVYDFLSSAAVISRPDCYWGRNCRTQVKAHHAV